MDAPKKPSKTTMLNSLNRELSELGSNLPLQTWLDKASQINQPVAKALDGIYCGREGRIHVEVEGLERPVWLTMGWHTVSTTPRVEYAYFS